MIKKGLTNRPAEKENQSTKWKWSLPVLNWSQPYICRDYKILKWYSGYSDVFFCNTNKKNMLTIIITITLQSELYQFSALSTCTANVQCSFLWNNSKTIQVSDELAWPDIVVPHHPTPPECKLSNLFYMTPVMLLLFWHILLTRPLLLSSFKCSVKGFCQKPWHFAKCPCTLHLQAIF